MYRPKKGYLNTGDVKNGSDWGSIKNKTKVKVVKKTIQTVGIKSLKKIVKLEETLCISLIYFALAFHYLLQPFLRP